MNLAPIVLFVYNRPWHTLQTLNALKGCLLADCSELFVFCDGAKDGASDQEREKIEEVRRVVKQEMWCGKVEVFESEINKGLATSIIDGVSQIIKRYGKIIVLEDDIVVSEGFLKYMNDVLEIYKDNSKVMHVSGYMYPNSVNIQSSIVPLRILSCWGWGTWSRAWAFYNDNVNELMSKIGFSPKAINRFNILGHAHFYEQLELNSTGKIKTWAVKWYASWLLNKGVSIFPSKSLVNNIGHDGSGINCGENKLFHVNQVDYIEVKKISLKENKEVRESIDLFFKNHFNIKPRIKEGFLTKLKSKMKFRIRSLFFYVFPDFRKFYTNNLNQYPFYHNSILNNSVVDSASKIYEPYKLNNSSIGKYSYVAPNSVINNTSIGKFCSIGPNFVCGWGKHPTDGISTSPMFYSSQKQNGTSLSSDDKILETEPILIGNDVFIGMNVTVLDGISIGDGAVIGAGAVVSKDIPPYAIAVGNPIRILRYRFGEEQINKFLSIKWWDWEEERLKEIERDFFDIDDFLKQNSNENLIV
jgi:acetyltransferase-like isoleucine patch superfamily enzyme